MKEHEAAKNVHNLLVTSRTERRLRRYYRCPAEKEKALKLIDACAASENGVGGT